MKKRILLTLAMLATLALTACNKSDTATTSKKPSTTSNNNNNAVVVDDHDRGSVDNTLPKIPLPDVIINNNNGSTYEANDEQISLGNGDYVETNAGSGASETVEGLKFLTATVNIGYEFLGWYNGDKLVSTQLKYTCKNEDENLTAKFKVKDEFECFEFTSTETECTITGLKDNYPTNLVVPEGVTKIGDNAFKESNVVNVTLPSTLEALGHGTFSYSKISTLTFKNVPESIGYSTCDSTFIKCVFVPESYTGDTYDLYNDLYANNYTIVTKLSNEDIYIDEDGFVFAYGEGSWDLVAYMGEETEIKLPEANEKIEKYYVGYYSFANTDIKKVEFSDAVLSISEKAFYYCDQLEEVIFSDSFDYIGRYAFYECDSLTEIVIPDNVEDIESDAFEYCDNLSKVTLGKKVDYIGSDAFYGCYKLYTVYDYSEYITVEKGSWGNGYIGYYAKEVIASDDDEPYSVKNGFMYYIDDEYKDDEYPGDVYLIGYVGTDKDVVVPTFDGRYITLESNLFSGNRTIETITLNEDCSDINSYAFSDCDSLKKIDAGGVTYIGYQAFYNCDNLEEAILPNVTDISSQAFSYSRSLKTVVSPKLVEIGEKAFCSCGALEKIDLENVDEIYDETFYQCYALKEAKMDNATSIGQEAFYNCYKLETAYMPKVTTIGNYAFYNCYMLRNVDISSLQTIAYHSYIFNNCYSLITLTFTEKFQSLESYSYAFDNCTNLREIVNLSNVTTLKNYTNAANEITDPDTQESILTYKDNIITYYNDSGKKIFLGVIDRTVKKVVVPSDIDIMWINSLYGCNQLEDLEMNSFTSVIGYYFGASGRTSNSSYYYSYNSDCVPRTLKTLRLGERVESIGNYAFYGCYSIENLYISKNLTSISSNSPFYGNHYKNIYYDGTIEDWCKIEFDSIDENPLYYGGNIKFKNGDTYSELVTVEIPDTINYIGNYQFYRFGFKKIVLPNTIEYIGDYAFYNCRNLNGIVIKSDLLSIGESAFQGCTTLISAKLGNSLTSIGDYAFSGCSLLYNVEIPDTLSSLGMGVFENCETLEEMTLEDTQVTEFKEYLFSNCYNLESLGFPKSLNMIASTTFENCDKLMFTTYKNGCYFGTEENPYRWLIKARAKTIVECIVHDDCEKVYDGAFSGCKNLKKIIIPATCLDCGSCLAGLTNVEYIEAPYTGTNDFGTGYFGTSNANLTSLKTIVINGGAIAANAFINIPGSIEIILDGNITSIGNNAFKGTSIESFVAPTTLKTIGNYAFQNCKSLVTVDLGSITTLGIYAFSGCSALSDLTFSNSLATISQYAFEKCTSLSQIYLTSSITKIDDYAFSNSGVENVNSTTKNNSFANVTDIGNYAFYASKIKKVVITSTLQHMLSNAFKECKQLTTVNTGEYHYISNYDTYNSISASAFEGCTALESFTSTCSTYWQFHVGASAFKGCTSLKTFSFKSLTSVRESAFEGSGLESFIYNSTDGYTTRQFTIYSKAFKDCKSLKTVSFTCHETSTFDIRLKNGFENNSTESVNIFEGCSNLTSVNLPSTTVTQYMFKDCTSLASFNFSNITAINKYAFQNTGFTYLELPETITTLGIYAFADCTKLETAILYRKISSGTFSGCTSLKDVTLSGLETTMPYDAFYNCSSLESIELAEGLTIIGDAAFSGTALTSLTLPSTLTKINVDAFRYTKIESVTIPSTVTTFGNYIFANNNSLKEVIIEEGVTTVPNYAFYNCSSLESVTLPSTLTSINQYAFYGCSSLASIIIPTGVSSIGSNAFNGCNNLKTIYNYSNLEIVAGATTLGCIAEHATSVINYSYDEVFFIPDENGFVFTIKDDKYYLVGYNGTATEITLPTTFTYNEVDVTEYEIYQNAFYGNTTITKLIIPSNVKAIKEYAFAGCTNLINIYNYSDIELTKGSKSNGYVAYYATTITTPYTDENNQVTDENGFIFAYVDDKGYLVGYNGTDHFLELPDSFEYEGNDIAEYEIYKYAFKDNLNIISIKIPYGVTAIGKDAFKGCYKLIEIYDISESHVMDNSSDFGLENEYPSIHKSEYDDSIIVVENDFVFAASVNNVLVAYIGSSTEITLPISFTYNEELKDNIKVCSYAFANSNFEKLTIPFEINLFDNGAFKDATINELVFENGNSGFGDFVFENCKIFKATIPAELIPAVNNYDSKNTSLTELTITSGTEISANALRDLPLKKVVLPDTITSIGDYAFYNCSELKEISLPSGLLTIGECAFRGCTKLESIVIPESLDTISYRAFYRCDRLRYITIMNKDVVVEDEAFYKTYIDEKVNVLCNGSEDDFADFEIDVYNGIVNAKKCYYRASKPSGDDMYNYWHYDSNGLPVIYKYEEQRELYEILVPRMKRALQNVKDGVGNYSISETGSADSYIIKNGDTYTITMKAYMRNIEDKYVADSDGYKLNWGIYSSDTSTLIIGINDDGFFLVNTPSVTTLKGYDFFCDEI